MDVTTLGLVGLIALALLFDYTNGFHDSANSVATVIATRVLRPRFAVAWAAFFNFVAFLIFGTAVANTVGSTVKTEFFSQPVVFAALLGAITWNYGSWHLGLPTSSSHALIGGLVGAGLAAGGTEAIKAASVRKALVFMVVSPIAGMLIGAVLMLVLRLVLRGRDVERTERGFRWAQLASSAAVSLGHGGNDAQKTMGVIAALLVATGHLTEHGGKLDVPFWVAVCAATAIALGTYSGGWRIVRTMGMDITALRPVSGFTAETAAAAALFGSTAAGAPVSTTHTVSGAITGVGTANSGATVSWRIFGRMSIAWILTIPVAALIGALAYWGTTMGPNPVGAVVMGAYLLVLAALVAVSLRTSPKADDVAPATGEEIAFPLRPGAGSVIGSAPDRSPEPERPRAKVTAGQPL
ncbi:inorganic phosphate transporter [Actinomadura parmotrematis]|uniref:Phosphate transporter n=1 Tax=Actinomadura parmotrematis TaxID=2864039 RepID=A0ABS7G3I8_9ACTN|nr:inorganic phosphate transporter [Actinomadura parmotrematis]MBW8487273.1 inorganic phosphate transporter [Actinomadura parmotrematis]